MMNESKLTKNDPSFVKTLTRHIAAQLEEQKARSLKTLMKRTILLMIAIFISACANHKEARRKSVQLYPGLPQREVVSLYGMPNKAQGNPDERNPPGDYDEHREGSGGNSDFQHRTEDELVWEYDNIDLKITFRNTQAGWVVKTWSID